eukprot:TRINITY_DN16145_c0_g2_i1.p1 TRINITY_DN16145_c0_g2~~TRINITY_DN16145_c0_g2_i1.p1  ORF type:complete len:491 (+),score=129.77 TRINITY_DN16145_c0_g2_i1:84-1556(+)
MAAAPGAKKGKTRRGRNKGVDATAEFFGPASRAAPEQQQPEGRPDPYGDTGDWSAPGGCAGDSEVKPHPCVVQFGRCAYGQSCRYKDMPGDTCLNYLRGTCTYRDRCWFRHDVAAGRCIGEGGGRKFSEAGEVKMLNTKLGVVDRSSRPPPEGPKPLLYSDPTPQVSTSQLRIHHDADTPERAVSLIAESAAAARRRPSPAAGDDGPQLPPDGGDLTDFPVLGAAAPPRRARVRTRPAAAGGGGTVWHSGVPQQGSPRVGLDPSAYGDFAPFGVEFADGDEGEEGFWDWAAGAGSGAEQWAELHSLPPPEPLREAGCGRTLERLTLREGEDLASPAVCILEAGTPVRGDLLSGTRLRLTHPRPGWVSTEVQGRTFVCADPSAVPPPSASGAEVIHRGPGWLPADDSVAAWARVARGPEERRIDPADGRAYTFTEFTLEYGGDARSPPPQWEAAAPAPCGGAGAAPAVGPADWGPFGLPAGPMPAPPPMPR